MRLQLTFAPTKAPMRPAMLVALITAGWRRLLRRRRQRATARTLQGLSDRTLRDVGLNRSEIEAVAYTDGRDRWPDRYAPIDAGLLRFCCRSLAASDRRRASHDMAARTDRGSSCAR